MMRHALWIVLLAGCGGDRGILMLPDQSNGTVVALYGIVREVSDRDTACDTLWSPMPLPLAETNGCSTTAESIFFPVVVEQYSSLALFLYALDNQQGVLGGGCVVRDIEPSEDSIEITIPLAAPTMPSMVRSQCITH